MKVHNKYHNTAPKDAVYIGRGSVYGNPYVIGKHGTREEVIAKFRKDLEACLDDPETQEALLALDGKDLVCVFVLQSRAMVMFLLMLLNVLRI